VRKNTWNVKCIFYRAKTGYDLSFVSVLEDFGVGPIGLVGPLWEVRR
jgi:hypothetical protein